MPLPRPRFVTVLIALLLATGPAVAAPAKSLSPLALSCLACHQPAVNAASMPALDHYAPAAIAASLRAARDQPQPGSIMARFAVKLGDAEIEQLAAELGQATSSSKAVGSNAKPR